MIVLKRLADAERDGDRIYAVVRGVGASSDGRARGLTAPSPDGQVRALCRAYAVAGVSPATATTRSLGLTGKSPSPASARFSTFVADAMTTEAPSIPGMARALN